MNRTAITLVLLALLPGRTATLSAQAGGVAGDTVKAGRFDYGKMWTFEYPPTDYFTQTYGFAADARWFENARLAALRIPGCSASFVSSHGLVVTNHHCARGSVSQVSRPGESLLDSGFAAPSLTEERRIPNYYVDQLIAVQDVSDEIFAAADRAADDAAREPARRAAMDAVQGRLRARYGSQGDSILVQVVGLYHGGRYSAYVFRRFTDVRLVAAAELQLGFFGGDADNFTYPRYDLDFAFLRVYGRDGKPFETDHWFRWSTEGVQAGDVVFVIGNPGPTNRLMTIAQLEFQRDVQVPAIVGFLSSRLQAMKEFREAQPQEAEAYDIRNRMFGLSNSLKASAGRLDALNDPVIMARKLDAERQLRSAIQGRENLRTRFGDVLDRIAAVQQQKRALGAAYGVFGFLANPAASPAIIRRALAAAAYLAAPADSAGPLRERLLRIGDVPPDLERRLLTVAFADLERWLGPDDAITRAALGGRPAGDAAAALLAGSVLANAQQTATAVGTLSRDDPALRLAAVIAPRLAEFGARSDQFAAQERELASLLGRARFEVYGRDVPPDATSSPRITDGVVRSYEYNGTLAPWHTTFYGVYDRYFGHGPGTEWDLPARWRMPPAGLDLSTSLNFVATADTYGGNSGSPAVRPDLSLVGINFDRNIEGLSRDFIYLPARGRNIMVDVRAILAAMDHVYNSDRIVLELTTGQFPATEQEADRARR